MTQPSQPVSCENDSQAHSTALGPDLYFNAPVRHLNTLHSPQAAGALSKSLAIPSLEEPMTRFHKSSICSIV
jgi:hypothetical protein